MRIVVKSPNEILARCANKVPNPNSLKIGELKYKKCNKPSLNFSYYDGRDTIYLCNECAKQFQALGLSIVE